MAMTDPSPEAMERAEALARPHADYLVRLCPKSHHSTTDTKLPTAPCTCGRDDEVKAIALALDEKDREIAEAHEAGKRDGAREMREDAAECEPSNHACPTCGAGSTYPCFGDQSSRDRFHRARWEAAIDALPLPGDEGGESDG